MYTKLFSETSKNDGAIVGGKSANLGEMTQAGFPVPPGFSVTSQAYYDFLEENDLNQPIREILKPLDVEDSEALQKACRKIRTLIEGKPTPEPIKQAILEAYHQMGQNPLVAVRSSATAEDLPEASFAGQQQTFLNISGDDELIKAVKGCWSSLFTARATYYREQKGFDHFKVAVAVPVQQMVQSDVSGVMFTIDPLTNDSEIITVEAVYGLGEGIVSGSITPDQYRINKESLEIIDKKIAKQKKMISQKGETDVSPEWGKKQKLSDQLIIEVAEQGLKLENHYDFPQDVEWAVEDDQVFIVQTRPVTTLNIEDATPGESSVPLEIENVNPDILLSGLGASPGIAAGKVQKISGAEEIDLVDKGEILVTTMTTPDFVPAMKRATAIVTDEGGSTCHAAIVSRELGVPCIVGTEVATQTLTNEEIITVNGGEGKIYQGDIAEEIRKLQQHQAKKKKHAKTDRTATKIYVNLGEPELAEKVAQKKVDGVGLLRAEFMIAEIGTHPRYLIQQNKRDVFVEKLSAGLRKFVKAFAPRPVIYRTTDFKTNEYRNLEGGEKFEPHEANPMLGVRGALRYIKDPQVFELELQAIKEIRNEYNNLWMLIPFVRTPEELVEVKKIMARHGLYRDASLKLFLMVEIPANVIMLERFIGVGIDGVSIGTNDLTQLVLGADRDNPKLGETFNEMNPAVLWAIERTIRECRQHGLTSSICGQAPSVYPELVEMLVEWGVSSISVNPDVIDETRTNVAIAEEELVQKRLGQEAE